MGPDKGRGDTRRDVGTWDMRSITEEAVADVPGALTLVLNLLRNQWFLIVHLALVTVFFLLSAGFPPFIVFMFNLAFTVDL